MQPEIWFCTFSRARVLLACVAGAERGEIACERGAREEGGLPAGAPSSSFLSHSALRISRFPLANNPPIPFPLLPAPDTQASVLFNVLYIQLSHQNTAPNLIAGTN